jgi:hypothetical protein
MFSSVNTKDPIAIQAQVQAAYLATCPGGDRYFVPKVFGWAIDAFTGNYKDYLPIDARYHDFEHTLQGTLCLGRILHGRHRAGVEPPLPRRLFELGVIAILMHDTGYLKHRWDTEGTGAKYTLVHVQRSAEFAAQLMVEKHFDNDDINAVQHMIRCTGLNANLAAIPFQSELERTVGLCLGTADLLGQMGAEDYIDKLPILYSEFAESARHNARNGAAPSLFSSAEDLIGKTPAFWEKYVVPKLAHDFDGVARFLNQPYPDGPNEYLQNIEASLARLRRKLGVPATA